MDEWLRKNSGKFDDKKVLKDDVKRLITSKDEAEFHDTYDVLSSTWSQTFKQYFESNVKQNLCNMVAMSLPGNSLHSRTEW